MMRISKKEPNQNEKIHFYVKLIKFYLYIYIYKPFYI